MQFPTGLIMATEKKWLWKATMAEKFFDASNRYQTFMVSYQLTVATAAPLLEDQVATALSHLYRYGRPSARLMSGNFVDDWWKIVTCIRLGVFFRPPLVSVYNKGIIWRFDYKS